MQSTSEKTQLIDERSKSAENDSFSSTDAERRLGTLPRVQAKPINRFLSAGGSSGDGGDVDMDALRSSFAAKLILAAVEGRHVESAVDMVIMRDGLFHPSTYAVYRHALICIIVGHLALALWEGRKSPFPFPPMVAAGEVIALVCYAVHVAVNMRTFGADQFRDKKWHFTFCVVVLTHSILMTTGAIIAGCQRTTGDDDNMNADWWETPRLLVLTAHALRPLMLISQMRTVRRVFSNILRTMTRTSNILSMGAIVLAFYSVLGVNLFNKEQVRGYDATNDNFNTFAGALLALFVLTTEENFPMVADPSFSQRPLVAYPFFVSFLLAFLVVILPLLLGIVLDSYAFQHAEQHARYRRKARNALLTAYYVLDEDGAMGVSEQQLVGVLTQASVGITPDQAEQLWETLVAEGNAIQGRSTSEPTDKNRSLGTPAVQRASESTTSHNEHRRSEVDAHSTTLKARARRMRSRNLTANQTRIGVHGFLHLADLLHQKVVVSDENDEIECIFGGPGDGYGGDDSTGTRKSLKYPRSRRLSRIDDESASSSDTSAVYGGGKQGNRFSSGVRRHTIRRSLVEDLRRANIERSSGSSIDEERRRWWACGASIQGIRLRSRKIARNPWFSRFSQGITVMLLALSLLWAPIQQENYAQCVTEQVASMDPACRDEELMIYAEGFLLLAFALEMTIKVVAVGWRRLFEFHWANRFDFIILVPSLVCFALENLCGQHVTSSIDNRPLLGDAIDLPRAIRVLRVLTVFPQLRELLDSMATVGTVLLKIMLLYSCVSYSYAAIGMGIFGGATSDELESRYSFTSLPEACLALFFMTVSNNWNDLLYPLINSVRAGRWSSLYFVSYMLFCATMMLDVLVGVVIEGFRVTTAGPTESSSGRLRRLINEAQDCNMAPLGRDSSHGDHDNEDRRFLSRESSRASSSMMQSDSSPNREEALQRKNSSFKKYKQVMAEDMFRPDTEEGLSAQDVRELEEAVKAVEARLHQVWLERVRGMKDIKAEEV